MKYQTFVSPTVTLLALLVSLSASRADQNWGGGSNTWTLDPTVTDWDSNTDAWSTNSQSANFTSNPGTVTVDDTYAPVGAYTLAFGTYNNNPAVWDVEPSTNAAGGAITLTKNGYNAVVYNNNGGGTTTIGSQLYIGSPADTDRYNIFDQSQGATGGTLILNNVTVLGNNPANNNHSLIIGSTNNATKIYLNGTFTDSSASGGAGFEIRFGEGGGDKMNYYLNGNFSGMTKGLSIGEGSVNVGSSAVLGTHQINIYNDQGVATQNSALYGTQGATVSNNIYLSAKYDDTNYGSRYGNGTVGVSDSSSVNFTGGIGLDSTNLILDAASGGRATISTNGINNQSPAGLTKTGAGTVVLATANSYGTLADGRDNAQGGTVAMDVKAGTLLITNTSGSAFGNGNQYGYFDSNSQSNVFVPDTTTVNIEAGATLGGSGISTQKVVALAANSHLAAGDAGQANLGIAASIGTLSLTGGITAANGLTLDFKLNGTGPNDEIYVGNGPVTIDGTLTFNFTNLGGALNTTSPYILVYSAPYAAAFDDTTANVVVNGPAGYTATISADVFNHEQALDVTFSAVPEPSTYALLGLGLGFLVFLARRKLA